jgi:hypothetical protein
VARRVRLTSWFTREVARVLPQRSTRGQALGRTLAALANAPRLPGPQDFEATTRPVGRAWVRRVAGRNLWVWYRFDEHEVALATITTDPPLPLEE